RSPPSLGQRYLAWYPWAVVPLIEALSSPDHVRLEVNKLTDRGIVEEGRAEVSESGIGDLATGDAPAALEPWLDRFVRHERCLLDAVEHPCLATVREALQRDPL